LYIIRNETAQSLRYARIRQDSETYYPELTPRLLKVLTTDSNWR
jgi:hypothetical protein